MSVELEVPKYLKTRERGLEKLYHKIQHVLEKQLQDPSDRSARSSTANRKTRQRSRTVNDPVSVPRIDLIDDAAIDQRPRIRQSASQKPFEDQGNETVLDLSEVASRLVCQKGEGEGVKIHSRQLRRSVSESYDRLDSHKPALMLGKTNSGVFDSNGAPALPTLQRRPRVNSMKQAKTFTSRRMDPPDVGEEDCPGKEGKAKARRLDRSPPRDLSRMLGDVAVLKGLDASGVSTILVSDDGLLPLSPSEQTLIASQDFMGRSGDLMGGSGTLAKKSSPKTLPRRNTAESTNNSIGLSGNLVQGPGDSSSPPLVTQQSKSGTLRRRNTLQLINTAEQSSGLSTPPAARRPSHRKCDPEFNQDIDTSDHPLKSEFFPPDPPPDSVGETRAGLRRRSTLAALELVRAKTSKTGGRQGLMRNKTFGGGSAPERPVERLRRALYMDALDGGGRDSATRRTAREGLEGPNDEAHTVSQTIRKVLALPPTSRTSEDVDTLYEYLCKLKSLRSYDPTTVREICAVVHHNRFGPNRVVVKDGHEAWAVYIILQGRVAVTHWDSPWGELTDGDQFGANEVSGGDGKRHATIVCRRLTHFLRIDKDDWIAIMERKEERDRARKIDALADIELIKTFNVPLAKLLPLVFEVVFRKDEVLTEFTAILRISIDISLTLPPPQVLSAEGSPADCIYFIQSGTCRVIKAVDQKHSQGSVSNHLLIIGTLEPGSYLGEGDVTRVESKRDVLRDDTQTGWQRPVSVVANNQVACCAVTKVPQSMFTFIYFTRKLTLQKIKITQSNGIKSLTSSDSRPTVLSQSCATACAA
ncbi:hypothetical protein HK104_002088 [Borealophlyctis nickersoniae]|nr:hypothetical protein HK104_002088 [Borealophlyctis nickersoniae]